jgi:hypothetical protein
MKTLEYKHRIAWFIGNYYETGMEYPILLETMKDADLDNFEWYDEIISIPTELPELVFEKYDDFCRVWEK